MGSCFFALVLNAGAGTWAEVFFFFLLYWIGSKLKSERGCQQNVIFFGVMMNSNKHSRAYFKMNYNYRVELFLTIFD